MNKTAIYWGTFLITIGGLLLIRSLGFFDADLSVLIRLWPVFFIFWGLSLIKFPEILRKVLVGASAVFLALFLFAVFTGGWSFTKHHIFHWKNMNHIEKLTNEKKRTALVFDSTVTKGSLNIKFGAGEFRIDGITDKFLEAEGSSFGFGNESDSSSPSHVSVFVNSPQENEVSQTIEGSIDVALKLNKDIDWYIDADFGAADAKFDLSPFKTPNININAGAASVNMTIGNRAAMQNVSIDCGASDIFVRIPSGSGCRIESNTILSGKDYEGFIESGNGYKTSNYDSAINKIEIKLNGAISNFNIVKY